MELKEIEQAIDSISEEKQKKIDWTGLYGKKYPVLVTYQKQVDIDGYAERIRELLDSLKTRYGYNDLDAMLVLKDILFHTWNVKK